MPLGNLRQLRKTLQLAIANAPEKVVREDIYSALPSLRGRAPPPALNALTRLSAPKAVSVSRELGLKQGRT